MTMRCWLVFLIVGIFLALAGGVGALSDVQLEVIGWDCNPDSPTIQVTLLIDTDWEPPNEVEHFLYRVVDGNENELTYRTKVFGQMTYGAMEISPFPTPLYLVHPPAQNPVEITIIDQDVNGVITGDEWSFQADSPCVPGSVDIYTDEPQVSIGTELVVYFMPSTDPDAWAYDMHIYAIDDNGNGYLAEVITADMIAALPPSEENLLVVDSWAGFQLYRLSTGYWQINLDPEENGYVSVTVFDMPVTEVYNLSFNVYDAD